MAENKTKATKASVKQFLDSVTDEKKREDAKVILKLMKEITKQPPKMWGPSIVGFGEYHYKYESGREGDFLITGFSPRKAALTIYIVAGFKKYDDLMKKLGKYKTGVSCLYIKKLEDIDMKILKQLIEQSYKYMVKKYNK